MIEREEVERLLWSCEHDPKAHLNMTAPALAALCRAWLALDGATTHSLCLLVENHLLMAQVSQRRVNTSLPFG